MKKRIKLCKGLSLLIATCMLFGINTTFLAADKSVRQTEYLEEHYQVNFKDVDVYIVDGKKLIIKEEDSHSFWTKNHVQDEIDMLETALNNTPSMEQSLIEDLQTEGELMAVGVAEAPVVLVGDHYERIATSEASTYATTYEKNAFGKGKEKQGNFYFYTNVKRSADVDRNGKYTYTTTSRGYWYGNSFTGGKKYPDAGEDYVLQSTPKGWVRSSDSMSTTYDTKPKTGIEGEDYWACEGGENYIQYAIVDDPLGWRQNTGFELVCSTKALASDDTRMINSYYIHTWKSLSLDVSITASSDKSVSLDIDPSIENKSWQLYTYVSFNF